MSDTVRLTPVQNKVIWSLQNGYILITDCNIKGALVARSNPKDEFHINNGVFWAIEKKGLIYQSGERKHFAYLLTNLGEQIKTKQPNQSSLTLP